MTRFRELREGDKFTWDNLEWRKVPERKNTTIGKYNAVRVDYPDIKKYFQLGMIIDVDTEYHLQRVPYINKPTCSVP